MKRLPAQILALAVLALGLTGCPPIPTIVNNAPAALTPSLLAVSHPGSPPVSVIPVNGRFDVMPDNAVIVDFQAPWPSSATISLNGVALGGTVDRNVMAGLQAQGLGYYIPLQTVPLGASFDWTISVVPPPALLSGTGFTISIVNTSINPNYSGAQQTSAPLVIPIGSRLYSQVSATPLKPTAAFCGNIPINSGAAACGPNFSVPQGKVTPNVEIRGWVVNVPEPNDTFNADPNNPFEEFVYSVLLDWGWTPDPEAVAAGIKPITSLQDIDSAFTPHNVIRFGVDATKKGEEQSHEAQLTPDALVWGGPDGMVVHVENDAWYNGGAAGNVGRKAGIPVPSGWVPAPSLDQRVSWSFDPSHPLSWPPGQAIAQGSYVRIVGTLWEDHNLAGNTIGSAQRSEAQCWAGGFTKNRGWHEIHPPDFVSILPPPPAHADALQTLEICGDKSFTLLLFAGQQPSASSTIGFEENVDGDFTDLRCIGQGSNTGSKTLTPLANGLRVDVTTKGTSSYGSKFKASYRVFWQ